MANNYSNDDLSVMTERQAARLHPQNFLGMNNDEGCFHGIFEIIANAIDEAREGYGKQIRVTLHDNGDLSVSDDGRGVPMDWSEKNKKYNWELVFCTLNAGGKLDSKNYQQSLGLNGIGATMMQYTSEYMDVTSVRDGKTYSMHFEKGEPKGKLQVNSTPDAKTGTTIRFKPDATVYTNINGIASDADVYFNALRKQAMLHPGIQFILTDERDGTVNNICFNKGVSEFINTLGQKLLMSKTYECESSAVVRNSDEEEPFTLEMRMGINFSRDTNITEIYHNGSHLIEGGTTSAAFILGIVKACEEYAKDTGKISKSDKFDNKDVMSMIMLIGVTNCPGHVTYFKHQTKVAVMNQCFKVPVANFAYTMMHRWFETEKADADKVIKEIINNKISREKADQVSKKFMQEINKGAQGIGNMPDKFTDCQTKNVADRELYIVEGDSALGACKFSRNAEFQAITPVGGKIMNCLKEDLVRIFNSRAIIDLLKIFRCGVEVKSKYIKDLPEFSINKLNWGKIIICTDADVDGMQIRCLVIAMIYRLCPSLLKHHKVYIAETPLFEITANKNTYFAYTQAEKDKILGDLASEGVKENKINVQRSKGLGENDAEMMSISTMHPNTRRLVPVEYPVDDKDVANIFQALLGDDIQTRKYLVEKYFEATETDID